MGSASEMGHSVQRWVVACLVMLFSLVLAVQSSVSWRGGGVTPGTGAVLGLSHPVPSGSLGCPPCGDITTLMPGERLLLQHPNARDFLPHFAPGSEFPGTQGRMQACSLLGKAHRNLR